MADLPGLPLARVEAHLRQARPGLLAGPLRAELTAGGRSNLTYTLTDGERRWVLRRPPLGHVLASAHDMAREHRLLAALEPTDVPVPAPVLRAGDDALDVIGVPFYVMEFADGRVLRTDSDLASVSAPLAAGLGRDLVDVLVRLHRLDPHDVGLGDLGRPVGYLDRQLSTWRRQLAASHSRDLPGLASLADRLAERVPTGQRGAVVHGDYRLDNVVVDVEDGDARVVAVLDWEMATLGDPVTDLASLATWWDGLEGLDVPVAAMPSSAPGWPGSDALVAAYVASAGVDLGRWPWYRAFALFKIAAIFEGIHYRAQRGLTVGPGFDRLGALVPVLAERGHDVLTPG